jgi:SNF2 family DNA or RNA helicase
VNFTPVKPQEIIIEHLHSSTESLVFVGMGIGKTAAVLHWLNDLFLTAEAAAALIIAPMRVANLTWPMEVKGWDQFKWMKVANLRTESGQRAFLNGTAHIYTINYDAMKTLVSLVERRGKKGLPYDVVVFDELTKAKNPGSKRINLYRRKMANLRPKWHVGLTGTPMPNSWMDLFAQVRLVDNGERLGNNFLEFKRTYFYGSEQQFYQWKEKTGTADALETKISDITVTLKSSEWLNIPDTVVEDVDIHFTPELRKRYEKLERDLVIQLRQDKVLNVANAAALVTKLLQFTSGHMYDDEREVHQVHDLKFNALRKIAKAEKQPLLVATIYQHEQARIRHLFPQAKFFGDAKNELTQRRMLDDWNAGKIPMLVSHPASVGHGLNLQHGSNILVWLTLTYSRELYEQMIARLARRGQEEITKVYRLMVAGTVDDAVAEAVATKAKNEARLISALQMLESYRNQ